LASIIGRSEPWSSFRDFKPELRRTHEEIKAFCDANERTLYSGRYWNMLNTGWRKQEWDTAKFKVLLMLPANGDVRAGAITRTSVRNALRQPTNDDVLVDFCYAPFDDEWDDFLDKGMPLCFGYDFKRPIQDYDMVFLSNCILSDQWRIYHLIQKSGVHMWHRDRLKDPTEPFILMGGGTTDNCEWMFGGVTEDNTWTKIDGTKDEFGMGPGGLIDGMFWGRSEAGSVNLVKIAMEHYGTGEAFKSKKREFIDELISTKFPGFYYPYGYKHSHEMVDGDPRKQNLIKIEKLREDLPDVVKYQSVENYDLHPIGVDMVLDQSGDSLGSQVYEVSIGCGGFGVCSFCHAGNMTGPWKEKSIPQLKKDFSALRKSVATHHGSISSLNPPNHSRYPDFLETLLGTFKDSQHSSFRTDEMSSIKHVLPIYSLIGMKSFTTSLEGISDRLRTYLNKNLKEEEILDAALNIMHNAIGRFKINLIFTGLETEDDWAEFKGMLMKMKQQADKAGRPNLRMEINMGALIIESNVPLQWARSHVALATYHALLEDRFLKWYPIDVWDYMKNFNANIDFNISGADSITEGLNRFVGREGSEFILELYLLNFAPIRRIFNKEWRRQQPIIEKYIDLDFMYREKPEDYLFPWEQIMIKPKKVMYKQYKNSISAIDTPFCLKTMAKQHDSCYGCQSCPSPKYTDWVLNRPLQGEDEVDIDRFRKLLNAKADRYSTRVWAEQPLLKGATVSPNIVAYRTTAAILDSVEGLEPIYNEVVNPRTMLSSKEQLDPTYGNFVWDIIWRQKPDVEAIRAKFAEISSKTDSIIIKNVYEVQLQDVINQEHSYILYQTHGLLLAGATPKEAIARFYMEENQEIIVGQEMGKNLYKPFTDKDKIFFKMTQDGKEMYMMMPLKFNPMSIVHLMYKKSYHKLFEIFSFKAMGTFRYAPANCSEKGCQDYAMIAMESNKQLPLCPKHLIQRMK